MVHGRLRDSMVVASFPLSRLARDELDKIIGDKGFGNRSDLLRFIIVDFLNRNGVDTSIINKIEREHRKTVENRNIGDSNG